MIECYFCGAKLPDADAAITAGWVPEFYQSTRQGAKTFSESVCPTCQAAHLRRDDDGEWTLVEPDPVEEAVRAVWKRHFGFPHEPRGLDRLDFHEVGVVNLWEAMLSAYRAGRGSRK